MIIKKRESSRVERKIKYDWVNNIVIACTMLGWSEREFWRSTPRKFYAFLYTYADLQRQALTAVQNNSKPEALIGKDAITALSHLASQIR